MTHKWSCITSAKMAVVPELMSNFLYYKSKQPVRVVHNYVHVTAYRITTNFCASENFAI